MVTYAVLGSEGQIGQYVLEESHGRDVVQIDLNLGQDLRKPHTLDSLGVDFAIFLAFNVGGATYLKDHQYSYEYIEDNIQIMHNTFRWLKETGIPFIFASSQMSNMIYSTYGMLKLLGEFYTRSLGGVNVRFWNVYGVEREPEKYHAITDFILGARNGLIDMKTDGLEERQFLYGTDAAKGIWSLVDHYDDLAKRRYYDITSFSWTSLGRVAEIISELHGGVEIRRANKRDITQKVRNIPNVDILEYWQPSITLRAGIKKVMDGTWPQ